MRTDIRLMVIGAHPDDCDGHCGGLALKYSLLGRTVKFVSVTDGSAGHQTIGRKQLKEMRLKEAENAGKCGNLEYQVLDFPDGELEVNLKSREVVLRAIREFKPNIIITHRPNDYHPDHRYTAQIVQDACYLVMVPAVCPDTPAMKFQPAVFFMSDGFKRPYPFTPDVVIDIDDVFDKKLAMLSCHESQFFDWLPWMDKIQNFIPKDYDINKYPFDFLSSINARVANRFRDMLVNRYGNDKGNAIQYAEAYELSEYGSEIQNDEWDEYFPK